MDETSKRRKLSLTVEERKARQNRLNRVLRLTAKEEAVQHMGGKCSECGGIFHASCYDFHHIDPAEKDVDPGSLIRRPKEILHAELAKCVLLCANCHRHLHWSLANKDTDWDERPLQRQQITFRGQTKYLAEWADEVGVKYETLRARLNEYGWDVEKALTTPVSGKNTNTPVMITANGETHNISEWARITGIPNNTLRARVRLGWDHNRIINTPLRKARNYDGSNIRG